MAVPKTFTGGERLFAADLNDNFEALDDRFDSAFLYAGTRVYESNGQFEKANPFGTGDIGLRAIRVRMVGGGGGGAGARATGGGEVHVGCSGTGAAYAEEFFPSVSALTASEPVVVGTGGAGGVAGASGSNGGNSYFIAIFGGAMDGDIQANGGIGGFSQNVSSVTTAYPGGAGQSLGEGQILVTGFPSGNGFAVPGGFVISGPGGSTPLGGGGKPAEAFGTNGSVGKDAEGYGGGGSGGVNGPSQSALNGGDGRDGVVIIDCYT